LFNDSQERRTATIRLDGLAVGACRELLTGQAITWSEGQTSLTLDAEDVRVLDLQP
jgi:hypothetical protein